ncbi:MAG: glycogen/starch synthase [Verrucomicrobiota bacterium]
MSILIATPELAGYTSPVDGPSTVAGRLAAGLSAAWRRQRQAVSLVMPFYRPLAERLDHLEATELHLKVKLGHSELMVRVWRAVSAGGVPLWLLERDEFFNRELVYGPEDAPYGDNPSRFLFFSHGAIALLPHVQPAPTLLHCVDWPTGAVPAITRQLGLALPTVFTFTTLTEQGRSHRRDFELTNLPWNYFAPHGLEFHGDLNLAKAGMAFAHAVTTVSPAYAADACTPEFGAGLDGVLRDADAGGRLRGIHPGIDTDFWDPSTIADCGKPFSTKKPGNKAACKRELQKLLGLAAKKRPPLLAWLAPLSAASGCERLMQVMNELVGAQMQLVVAADGEPFLRDYFRNMAEAYPKQIAFQPTANPGHLFHLLAGADFLLCPAGYPTTIEPILEAARLGVLPVTEHQGAARDWLLPVSPGKKKVNKKEKGLIPAVALPEGSAETLLAGLRAAIALAEADDRLAELQAQAMSIDYGWDAAAKEYQSVYKKAKKRV